MNLPVRSRSTRGAEDGQALVEFALILPIALVILMGIIQFGMLFAGHIGVTNAVRETARYGSTSPISDSTTAAANGANVCTYLVNSALASAAGYSSTNVVQAGATRVTFESYADPHTGTPTYSIRMTVHVAYRHPLLVPLVGGLIDSIDGTGDDHFRLNTVEAMRVENPVLTADPLPGGMVTVNC